MQNALADTGPLVALFDGADHGHAAAKRFVGRRRVHFVTTWAVLAEVCALLPTPAWLDFLEFAQRRAVTIVPLDDTLLPEALALSNKYADLPMDAADCSLMLAAMATGLRDIVTFNSDFDVYRLPGNKRFRNLMREAA